MGFNDREIIALSGAHNLGRCRSDRSGFEGKWVGNPTRFSNTYFRLLMMHEWKRKRLENEMEQYVYVDADLNEELMMLLMDIALSEDPKLIVWMERYAKDKDLFFVDLVSVFAQLMELASGGTWRRGSRTWIMRKEGICPRQRRAHSPVCRRSRKEGDKLWMRRNRSRRRTGSSGRGFE
jgi:catalase (peroxidase I)